MDSEALKSRLEVALAAAREAGKLTLSYFRDSNLAIDIKADQTPVTLADRGAEELLRQRIAARFPSDAILGEEFPEQAGTSGFQWILDPIDGTKSFIHGVPLYGTLIGIEHRGQSVLGVIHMPALDETIYATTGAGAWYAQRNESPRAARVSSVSKLADALISSSDTRFPPEKQEAYTQLQRAAGVSRTWGDCYGYLLVATGRADVMIDPLMNVWDAAALQPILVEAGGSYTDWQGRPTIHNGEGIGTNGLLLPQVLAIIRARQ